MEDEEFHYVLYCRSNGCRCGTEETLDKAREACKKDGCGYCDGHLMFVKEKKTLDP